MRQVGNILIGPIEFALRSRSLSNVEYPVFPYGGFYRQDEALDVFSPQIKLDVDLRQQGYAVPTSPPDFESGQNWAYWKVPEGHLICSGIHQRETARAACLWPSDSKECQLFIDADPQHAPLRYPLDQILAWVLLGKVGAVLMHAALIEKEGRAWVLAGHSGAGKSTLSELAHTQGWRVLNDDRTIIHPDPLTGAWLASGTPWHGSGRFAEADTVPLHGIAFLHQATECRMETLAKSQALRAMLNVVSVPWFEDTWLDPVIGALDNLGQSDLFHNFYFSRSVAAVDLLEGVALTA